MQEGSRMRGPPWSLSHSGSNHFKNFKAVGPGSCPRAAWGVRRKRRDGVGGLRRIAGRAHQIPDLLFAEDSAEFPVSPRTKGHIKDHKGRGRGHATLVARQRSTRRLLLYRVVHLRRGIPTRCAARMWSCICGHPRNRANRGLWAAANEAPEALDGREGATRCGHCWAVVGQRAESRCEAARPWHPACHSGGVRILIVSCIDEQSVHHRKQTASFPSLNHSGPPQSSREHDGRP